MSVTRVLAVLGGIGPVTAAFAVQVAAAAPAIDCSGVEPIVLSGFSGDGAYRLGEEAKTRLASFAEQAAQKSCPLAVIGFANGEQTNGTARTIARERAERTVAAMREAGVPDAQLAFVRWRPTREFGDAPEANSRVLVRPNPDGGFKCSALAEGEVEPAPALPPVTFGKRDVEVDEAQSETLDRIADAVKSAPCQVTIQGHASLPGDRALNRRLSAQRAVAVRKALVERGVSNAKMSISVVGPTDRFGHSPAANRVAVVARD